MAYHPSCFTLGNLGQKALAFLLNFDRATATVTPNLEISAGEFFSQHPVLDRDVH